MISLPDLMRKVAKELKAKYEHCSTQVDFPDDLANKIIAWGKKNISDDDLQPQDNGKTGREDDIHVTVLYGLNSDDPEPIKDILKDYEPFEVRLGLISAFRDNKEFDVLKIDMESPELLKLHYAIEKGIKNDNSYPTYSPHCTVAYMKKGRADKYISTDDLRGKTFKVDRITVCNKDGEKTFLSLKG